MSWILYLEKELKKHKSYKTEKTVKKNIDNFITFITHKWSNYNSSVIDYDLIIEPLRIAANIALDIKTQNISTDTYFDILSKIDFDTVDFDSKSFGNIFNENINWINHSISLKIDKNFSPYPVQYARIISLKSWIENNLKTSVGAYVDLNDFTSNPNWSNLQIMYSKNNGLVKFGSGTTLRGGKKCAWLLNFEELKSIYEDLETDIAVSDISGVSYGRANKVIERIGYEVHIDTEHWANQYFITLIYPEKVDNICCQASSIHAGWGKSNMFTASNKELSFGWGETTPIYCNETDGSICECLNGGVKERVHIEFPPKDYEFKAYYIGCVSKSFISHQNAILENTIKILDEIL